MLDDLKYINKIDKQDALGAISKQWQQLGHCYDFAPFVMTEPIKNIVWSGMGGSALPATISFSWPTHPLPFEISRGYSIPAYVDSSTLFISSSYSGNTEETLEALNKAEQAGAQIIIITAGGILEKRALKKGYSMYRIPIHMQPRMTTLYFLNALAHIYDKLGFGDNLCNQLVNCQDMLKREVTKWEPTVPVSKNPAKQLALELIGKSIVIYGGSVTQAIAQKFKLALNENAKTIAWWNQLPEFTHNELVGWSSHPIDKPYAVVDIRSNLEHPKISQRFEVAEKLLSGLRPSPHIIRPVGKTIIEQLLWGMNFCDYVSVYVAILQNIDPTPTMLVEKLKKN